ncbi:MAG: type II toxin-antitoxin system ParD family antitoxin [Magnetococcales bacterium]|nr:type II toxin-antitoxin system ParD family antitoxin [Magnetococcales bacterium]
MSTNIHLTPELESFACGCVASGRFNTVSEVVYSAMKMFQEKEERRKHFNAMLDDVRQETQREGACEAADVLAEVDRMIEESSQ